MLFFMNIGNKFSKNINKSNLIIVINVYYTHTHTDIYIHTYKILNKIYYATIFKTCL